MDFFTQVSLKGATLNQNEKRLLEHIVRNSRAVKDMSIRELSSACFVSTTTIMRFARKLGFSGYKELAESLRFSYSNSQQDQVPDVIWKSHYAGEYVKNIAESVRVLSKETVDAFCGRIAPETHVYCIGSGLDREAAHYAYRMLTALGYSASCPEDEIGLKTAARCFGSGDSAMVFSVSGESPEAIGFLENVEATVDNPAIATFTQSANNTIQALSPYDFYVFTERIVLDDVDFSTRISMMALVDLICYELLARRKAAETAI